MPTWETALSRARSVASRGIPRKGFIIRHIVYKVATAAIMIAASAVAGWAGDDSPIKVIRPQASTSAAEFDIERIFAQRKPVPVTPSGSLRPTRPVKLDLPQENTAVLNRRCTIQKDQASNWYVLHFVDAQAGDVDRWALPCEYLEIMEKHVEERPGTVFLVSGESHVYKDKPFLLLRKVVVEPAPQPRTSRTTTASAPAATAAAAAATPDKERADVSPDALMEELLKQKLGQPILLPVDPPTDVAAPKSVAPVGKEITAAPARQIIDKVARIVQTDDTWWTAKFETDNTLQEPPLRVVPCTLLSMAERAIDGDDSAAARRTSNKTERVVRQMQERGGAVRFRISGEVLTYKGKQFLLLRKVIKERNLGQF